MDRYEDRLWHRIFRRFSILLAIKTTLVVILAYYTGTYISNYYHLKTPEIAGLWCAISGILVLQALIHDSFSLAGNRILGSFIGALISFLFSTAMGYSLTTLALCTFTIVILTSALKIKHTARLASLTAAVIIIVGTIEPTIHPFINASLRFTECALGSIIAAIMTFIFFPLRKKLNLLNNH